MKKLMDKIVQNKKLLIIVISITLVLISLLGTSFALIYKEKVLDANNSYTTGDLTISLNSGTVLTLNNSFPMTDTAGASTTPYTFTVQNTGTVLYKYTLKLVSTTTDNIINSDYIKIKIDDKEPVTLSSINDILYSNLYLEASKSQTFNIRIWLDENTPNSEIGKSYAAKVVLEGESADSIPKTGAQTLIDLYNSKTATPVTTTGGESITQVSELGMMQDSFGNLRYYGLNPNNYVNFNGEEEGWRIIGVFNVEDENGNTEQRIKLIRTNAIGSYAYDNKTSGIGSSTSSYGSNDWSDSRLMIMLNPPEETATLRASDSSIYTLTPGLYWNSGSGSCYSGSGNTAVKSCNFTSTGMTDEGKAMIGQAKYSLLGVSSGYADDWYDEEQTTGTSGNKGSHATSWTGYVGIMYPSDYAYASDLNVCTYDGLNYNDDTTNCTGTNWIFQGNVVSGSTSKVTTWTISPVSYYASVAFSVYSTGYVVSRNVFDASSVRPVVYLSSHVGIVDGTGAPGDPYILG